MAQKRSRKKKSRRGLGYWRPKTDYFPRGHATTQIAEYVSDMEAKGCRKIPSGKCPAGHKHVKGPTGSYQRGGPGKRSKVWIGNWCCPTE